MPTGLSTTAANALLTSLSGTYTWVQLHVGQPGAAGTSNVAVETTRHQATWAAPAGGSVATSVDLSWTNVAGTEDYTHFTVWTLNAAGAFGFSGTITANPVVAGDTFTFVAGSLTASFPLAS